MPICWRMPPQKAFDATFDVDDSLVNEDESELPQAAGRPGCGRLSDTKKQRAVPFAGHGSCCLQTRSGLGSLDLLDQLGNDLVQIADDAVGGNVEDGGVLVLVDGDDVLGVLHTGNVLDGTGDAQRNVDAGMHGLTGLADLMVGSSASPHR